MKLLLISMFLIILIVNSTNPLNDPLNSQSSISKLPKEAELSKDILLDSIFLEKSNTILKDKSPSYTVSFKSNHSLKKSPSYLNKLIKTNKCSEKTGFLYLLDSEPKKGKTVMKTTKMYVSLNPNTMSLFTSFDHRDIKDSIKTKMILRITQKYKGTFCFDVQQQVGTEYLPIKVITLCVKSMKEMNEWINAIVEFKKCDISETVTEEKNKTDKAIINHTEYARTELDQLKYFNSKPFRPNKLGQMHKSVIKSSLKGLLKTYKSGKIAGFRARRVFRGRLAHQIHSNMEDESKEYTIQKIIEMRQVKERENQIKFIRLEHKHKELSLINDAQRRIKELKDKK